MPLESTESIETLKQNLLENFKSLYGIEPSSEEKQVFSSLSVDKLRALLNQPIPLDVFSCTACNDGRRIRVTDDRKHPYFGVTFPCPTCTSDDDLVRATGVDRRYMSWKLEDLSVDPIKTRGAIDDLEGGHSLAIYGEVGRGKTHLAVGLIREWVVKRRITKGAFKAAKFIYFPQFLDDLRELFGDTRQAQQAQQYETNLASFDLLVVDDLGAERTTEWVVERVNVLLDRRLRENKQTILTTNLMSLGEIENRYGSRAASRLGGYRWHECSGRDWRLAR